MSMTQKQKIVAAARGEHLDKLPFGARIDLWYNYHTAHGTIPEKYKGWSQFDILRDLDVGAQYKFPAVTRETYQDMEVIEKDEPPYLTREFRTPLGTVTEKEIHHREVGAWGMHNMEKIFKSEKDYPIINYIIEHTVPADNFEVFNKGRAEVGEGGMIISGAALISPTQRIMRDMMGFERFYYQQVYQTTTHESLIQGRPF